MAVKRLITPEIKKGRFTDAGSGSSTTRKGDVELQSTDAVDKINSGSTTKAMSQVTGAVLGERWQARRNRTVLKRDFVREVKRLPNER